MQLPKKIFFTGAPGSTWSGISQHIERISGFNTSDRIPERWYPHKGGCGHIGAYFASGTECPADWDNVDYAWTEDGGCKLVKSHEWAEHLDEVADLCREHGYWIMMVYRPTLACLTWWYELGGFSIKFPDYSRYKNHATMQQMIELQNDAMLSFGFDQGLKWENFTAEWVKENFGESPTRVIHDKRGVLVSIYRP